MCSPVWARQSPSTTRHLSDNPPSSTTDRRKGAMGASRRDRRKSLLGILAEHPGGMLMEALIREAAAPTDRLRVLDALRRLANDGRISIARYQHGVRPPRIRLAVTWGNCG